MIGGCLDCIMALVGTRFDHVTHFIETYKEEGILWFFDCCELTSEALIRSIWRLEEADWFSYTKGFIFGRSATNQSDYGTTFKEALQTALQKFAVPVIMDADIGHKRPQMTIINGAYAKIHSGCGKGSISFILQ